MTTDAAGAMKSRLRTDLRDAMKGARPDEARLIRALVAALDNAQAPPLPTDRKASDLISFHDGAAEIDRLSLSEAQVHAVLAAEMQERERAAATFTELGRPDRAETLSAEALLVKRYLE